MEKIVSVLSYANLIYTRKWSAEGTSPCSLLTKVLDEEELVRFCRRNKLYLFCISRSLTELMSKTCSPYFLAGSHLVVKAIKAMVADDCDEVR